MFNPREVWRGFLYGKDFPRLWCGFSGGDLVVSRAAWSDLAGCAWNTYIEIPSQREHNVRELHRTIVQRGQVRIDVAWRQGWLVYGTGAVRMGSSRVSLSWPALQAVARSGGRVKICAMIPTEIM